MPRVRSSNGPEIDRGFGNAGEVDILLDKAKLRQNERMMKPGSGGKEGWDPDLLKHLDLSYESSFAYFPLSWMYLCCGCSSLLSARACVCLRVLLGALFWTIWLELLIYQINAL